MKKSLVILLLATGCAHISVTEKEYSTDGQITKNTTGTGNFFFANSQASKIVVGKKTSKTSLLFGADSLNESGDTNSLAIIKELIGDAILKAIQGAK